MPIRQLKNTAWRPSGQSGTVRRRVVVRRTYKRPQARQPKKNWLIDFLSQKKIIKRLLILAAIFIVALAIFLFAITRNLPNPNQLMEREIAQTTKIYDRTGENVLYEISGDEKRTLIQLQDIPNNAKNATIAIEDKNFYKHGGISIWAMVRTMITNVVYGRSAGGSTLTQQFIKNAVLSNEKTFTRKIKEIVLSQRLEKKFSKDEILQMYLNEIPYGSNAYGIEAASQKYFGKSVRDVSLAEAAVLAALPQAPSRYSPYGPNKQLLLDRQKYILDIMVDQGYISESERDTAKAQEIKFATPESNIKAPHFVMYIKDILSEKYGEKEVEQGGFKIYTTLDINKQKIAEEVIEQKTEKYQEKYNASNAALVSIDPKNGQILAMVGSRDYFDDSIDGQVNVATSLRQPGSSIKPVVYAALFEKGYTPDTILYDVVTNFAAGGTPYEPHNYDGKEHGPVTIRQALAGSLNVPAVKAIYLAGIQNVINLAKDMGYSSLTDPDRYGLSLVLGGAEVRLLEHVNAFSAFAREGEVSPVVGILKVEDKDGNILEEFKEKKKTVMPSQIARMINSIMTDNGARAFIFGEKNYLTLPDRPVATKTGTTNDFKDAWTIGYTPSIVTGVWVGNNSSKEMKKGSDGSVLAAPIWNEYMKQALAGTPVENFNAPADYKTGKPVLDGDTGLNKVVSIDKRTDGLADSNTPAEFVEQKTFNNPHSILYYVDKDDPLGPKPENPAKDPQFNLWESRIITWAQKNNLYSTSTIAGIENVISPKEKPEFNITKPGNNEIITDPNFVAQVEITRIADNANVEYYINNNLVYKTSVPSFTLNKKLDFLNNGYHNLKVKVCDNYYNCTEKSVEFNLLLNNNYQSPASLNLTAPGSGLSLTDVDFPLSIQFASPNPEKITKIDVVALNSNDQKTTVKTLGLLSNNSLSTTWDYRPNPGSYKLYGEYYDWGGTMRKTNQISVMVQ
jgi:1A family penicillin-binding protein